MFSFSRFFAGAKRISAQSLAQIGFRKTPNHFFSTTESTIKPTLPQTLKPFLDNNETAKNHYFKYQDYFRQAEIDYREKRYSHALKDVHKARRELAETTDLCNMSIMAVPLFNKLSNLQKKIHAEITQDEQSDSLSLK